jgi:histidine triad (HIT) family protein
MQDCIFCKIASGEIPSTKVHEDSLLLAFEDVNPVAPTHVLVIPKTHIPTLNDVSGAQSDLLGKMILRAKDIARERGFSEDGYRLVMNCMEGAGQSVFHIHLHLLGGRPFDWPPG